MTPPGPPPKPTATKVLQGTFRRDRHGDGGVNYPTTKGSEPPAWMLKSPEGYRGYALDEWERLVPLLESQLVMTEADWSELSHYCTLHGKIVAQYVSGEFPPTQQLSELRQRAGHFGLTPASRTRIPASRRRRCWGMSWSATLWTSARTSRA